MAESISSPDRATLLDQQDPLRTYREQFFLPEEKIYMDGNSLGLASRPAVQLLYQAIDDWKNLAIGGWLDAKPAWFDLPEVLARMQAPLLGATEDEVLVGNSTTVNLHQILSTFYRPEGTKTGFITDETSFPSDAYAIQSQLYSRGLSIAENLIAVPARNRLIEEDDIIATMDRHQDTTAMLVLPVAIYSTGQLLDVERITREAHDRGILVCWDGSHSVGAIPHEFDNWNVDVAVWCNYKYLNAGPGAVGGLYVNSMHLGTRPGLAGWWSSMKSKQFDMEFNPTFAEDARAYQIGTPPIFSMIPLQASLEMFQQAGIENIREKSLNLTSYLMNLVQERIQDHELKIVTPLDKSRRGGHVSLAHPEAVRINEALKAFGVVPDFRKPDIVRLAPIALYTSYKDVYDTVEILRDIMDDKMYMNFSAERGRVA